MIRGDDETTQAGRKTGLPLFYPASSACVSSVRVSSVRVFSATIFPGPWITPFAPSAFPHVRVMLCPCFHVRVFPRPVFSATIFPGPRFIPPAAGSGRAGWDVEIGAIVARAGFCE